VRYLWPVLSGQERRGTCADTDARVDVGNACPSCVEYLGERNPERFPSIGEYEDALQRYPKPVWPSKEDAVRAQKDDASYESGWVSRT
jgi:hypothetical protein